MGAAQAIDDPLWRSGGGETPLSPEDIADLIPTHITLRRELNEVEADGVSRAIVWTHRRKWTLPTLIDPDFICALHKRMFRDVWKWAGLYRVRDVNIVSTSHREIRVELHNLREDAKTWTQNEHSPDEIAVRFHHRLVLIHPFPNGNGRLSRLMGDLLARAQGREPFPWGTTSVADFRPRYLAALRAADKGDIGALLELSRLP